MNQFDQIENKIKDLVEKGSDRLPWADKYAAMVDHFCESLRLYFQENPDCFQDSPSELRVFLSPDEARIWKQHDDWHKVITDALIETTIETGCKPNLLPVIRLTAKNSLQYGEIYFSIEQTQNEHEKTGAVNVSKPLRTASKSSQPSAGQILIDPNTSIPIEKTILNLGRKSTNDIVLEDMRVSRMHAQIRKTHEGYMIFDVGSTGGTFINGERITSKLLKTGDVISLGGFTVVFTNEGEFENASEREITSDLAKQGQSEANP